MREAIARFIAMGVAILSIAIAPAFGAEGSGGDKGHGGADGGASGCGDLFGDLVEVLRDTTTGVPILQKRWVEASGTAGSYAWGYCPIALYVKDPVTGERGQIPFVTGSCDPAVTTEMATIPVDYFGRLSAGRTKQRNIRMHFDEVISKIKTSQVVWRDATGRLALGTECKPDVDPTVDPAACTWTVVDSPVENIALYARLMKYGHLQSNPLEVDVWLGAKGDPAAGVVFHPALGSDDYPKFLGEAKALLPKGDAKNADGEITHVDCPAWGEPDPIFNQNQLAPVCYEPESLDTGDFVLAAAYLATGADKDGIVTTDLVQYMNRILKIPIAVTDKDVNFPASKDTLPALYRECGSDTAADYQPDTAGCAIKAAVLPVPDDPLATEYPAPANERFVDYGTLTNYDRATTFNWTVVSLRPASTLGLPRLAALEALLNHTAENTYVVELNVPLYDWLLVRNLESGGKGSDVDGFVKATSDALRSIEFVHNYKVPVDLTVGFEAYKFEPLPVP